MNRRHYYMDYDFKRKDFTQIHYQLREPSLCFSSWLQSLNHTMYVHTFDLIFKNQAV